MKNDWLLLKYRSKSACTLPADAGRTRLATSRSSPPQLPPRDVCCAATGRETERRNRKTRAGTVERFTGTSMRGMKEDGAERAASPTRRRQKGGRKRRPSPTPNLIRTAGPDAGTGAPAPETNAPPRPAGRRRERTRGGSIARDVRGIGRKNDQPPGRSWGPPNGRGPASGKSGTSSGFVARRVPRGGMLPMVRGAKSGTLGREQKRRRPASVFDRPRRPRRTGRGGDRARAGSWRSQVGQRGTELPPAAAPGARVHHTGQQPT